jgi:hypothetical protein
MKLFHMPTTHHLTKPGATTIMSLQPLPPISELLLPWIAPSQFPHIKHTIEAHGGTVTIQEGKYHLSFPEGTVQQDKDHMVGVPRQKIIFPDGWWLLYEHGDRGRLPDAPQEEQPGE